MFSLLPPDAAAWTAPAHPTSVVVGFANPEWLHFGVEGRRGRLGYGFTVGTLSLAYDLSATGRYFFCDEEGGPFLDLGLSALRLAPLSDQTPGTWSPLLAIGLGYQFVLGPCPLTIGLGLDPIPLAGSLYQPLIVTNAQALPRVLLQTGYSF